MNHDKLSEFLGRFTADFGATGSAGLVVVGNRLGLYRALAQGPATAERFAERTGYNQRYLTEWLRNQAAGGYVSYDAATGEFFLSEEQAFCLADPNGPNLSAAFLISLGYLRAEPQLTEAFRTGKGIAWHEHHEDVFVGCDAFYRPGSPACGRPRLRCGGTRTSCPCRWTLRCRWGRGSRRWCPPRGGRGSG